MPQSRRGVKIVKHALQVVIHGYLEDLIRGLENPVEKSNANKFDRTRTAEWAQFCEKLQGAICKLAVLRRTFKGLGLSEAVVAELEKIEKSLYATPKTMRALALNKGDLSGDYATLANEIRQPQDEIKNLVFSDSRAWSDYTFGIASGVIACMAPVLITFAFLEAKIGWNATAIGVLVIGIVLSIVSVFLGFAQKKENAED